MNGKDQNSLEFLMKLKKNGALAKSNETILERVLTFARKYHKEKIEYSKGKDEIHGK